MMIFSAQAHYAAGTREVLESRFEMKLGSRSAREISDAQSFVMANAFRWFFQNGIHFGQHHSAISKIIDD
jgi:hypothetical protein